MSHHAGYSFEWRNRAITFYTSQYEIRRWKFSYLFNSTDTAATGVVAQSFCDRFNLTSEWFPLTALPEDCEVSCFADALILTLRSDWSPALDTFKSGSLLSVKVIDFIENGPSKCNFFALFTPSAVQSLDSFIVTKNFLLVQSLDKVKSLLSFWRYIESDGSWQLTGQESDPQIRDMSVRAVDSDEGDLLWVTCSSYLRPPSLFLR